MGLFDLFRKPDFKAAAEAIKAQTLGTELADSEQKFAADLGIDLASYSAPIQVVEFLNTNHLFQS